MEKENVSYVQIHNLNKSFAMKEGELKVLGNINIDIQKGEFICILGTSGCGKSTMLRMLAGLDTLYTGEVKVDGEEVKGPNPNIGMIFQESRLFPWMRVRDNIKFGIKKGVPKEEQAELIEKHIELVGLKGFEKSYPHQLSGGMQQRVSIARSLIGNPKILLLDEPFGALDALTRMNMQQETLRIWEKEQATMILVTHDIDEAIYLGSRIVILSSRPGKVKEIIDVDIERPRKRTSKEFAELRNYIYNGFFAGMDNE